MHLPPVHVAILAFQGTRPLAAAIGKPFQRVQEWARPYAAGGNDGEFPNPVIMREVYRAAERRGIVLNPNDLFFGKDIAPEEARRLMETMPPQARASWWPLQPDEPEPAHEPAPPRGR